MTACAPTSRKTWSARSSTGYWPAVSPAVAERLARGVHTSTFGGNPLAAAGVLATLSVLTLDALARVDQLGRDWMTRLAASGGDHVKEVRGRGLMIGVAVRSGRDQILKDLQKEGVLAIPAGEDVIRFLPPLIVEAEQLAEAAEALQRVMAGASS